MILHTPTRRHHFKGLGQSIDPTTAAAMQPSAILQSMGPQAQADYAASNWATGLLSIPEFAVLGVVKGAEGVTQALSTLVPNDVFTAPDVPIGVTPTPDPAAIIGTGISKLTGGTWLVLAGAVLALIIVAK